MTAITTTPTTGLQLQARLDRPGFVLDVDMALPGKGLTALLGPSGSGKTTCLRVLAGLEPNARGVVQVLGEAWQDSARGVCLPVHRRPLGYVFQEASLFDHLSVQDNIRFGFQRTPPAQRRHGWDHGLELLGIGHLCHKQQVVGHGMVLRQLAQACCALAVALAQGGQQHGRYFTDGGRALLDRGHADTVHGCLPLPLCLLLICRYQRSWWVLAQRWLT